MARQPIGAVTPPVALRGASRSPCRRPQRAALGRWLLLAGLLALLGPTSLEARPDAPPAVRALTIDGAITTATYDYLDRALASAGPAATAVLVELDTPGGDSSSALKIVSRMLNAPLPVLVWVGPQGAQAASAGTFLVLAAHASGMAPVTMIGAASPVAAGGSDLPATEGRKATEDLAATARALARRRGARAVDWAERAVREAASASSTEALELGLIDVIAPSRELFLADIDGMTVTVNGVPTVLRTKGAAIEDVPMRAGEQLLALLIHPAVALLLLTLGVNAILIELSSPGGFVAGAIGVLALVLAFYSLGVLGANWVGLVFIGVAFALFVLDIKAPTHGVLTAAGVAVFVGGSVVMFRGGWYDVPWGTIAALALGMGLFFAFVVSAVVRVMRRRPITGTEGLEGRAATVRKALAPDGMVFVEGELWRAHLADGEPVPSGASVRILRREGNTLVVRREP